MRRSGSEIVAPLVGTHRERVGEEEPAGCGLEFRLQNQRSVEVSPANRFRAGDFDGPVSRPIVQQTREHGGRIEPRQAQPIHRPGTVHQGGRVAVGEEGVLGDGVRLMRRTITARPRRHAWVSEPIPPYFRFAAKRSRSSVRQLGTTMSG